MILENIEKKRGKKVKNKKSKKVIKIILIILGILLGIYIVGSIFIGNIMNDYATGESSAIEQYTQKYTVKKQNITSTVKGVSEITSFNVSNVDLTSYGKIVEWYVSDGSNVSKNQNIVKVGANGYNQILKSSISGMFFLIDDYNYSIYDTSNIGVQLNVIESDVANLQVGQKAKIRINALNKDIEGKVTYISKLPKDGKFKVKIQFDFTDEIKFGYAVSINIETYSKNDVLVIPYDMLHMDSNGKYYVITNDYASDLYYDTITKDMRTYVEVGVITKDEVEIISGLKENDIIISSLW